MTVVDVYNLKSEKISETELKDEVFDSPVKAEVLKQAVMGQLCNRRAGTASAKNRSEIKGSKTKLWRQKGTGRARVGTAASPTRRGGGVAFGPVPRRFRYKVSKKLNRSALCMALSDKYRSDRFTVVDDFSLPEIKTKSFLDIFQKFGSRRTLIVTNDKQINLEKSSRNVQGVKVMRYEGINVYDVLSSDHLIVEEPALGKIQEALIS